MSMTERLLFTISDEEVQAAQVPESQAGVAGAEVAEARALEEPTQELDLVSAESAFIFGFVGLTALGPHVFRAIRDRYARNSHQTQPTSPEVGIQ